MTNRRRDGLLLLASLAVLALPALAGAQSPDQRLDGSVAVGFRGFLDRPGSLQLAKFEEYRDMSAGPFLQALRVDFQPDSGRTIYSLRAAELFRRDQALAGRVHRPGAFDLRLGWDRISHTYSTDARMVAGASTSAPFTLPSTLTRTLADTLAWQSAPYLGAVRTGWDVAQACLTLTPGTHNDLKLDVTNISKSGGRPMSMSFSAVSLYREFLEPIDQTTRDVKLSESYVRQRYQLQLAWDLNAFDNASSSVSADNPLLATSSPTAGSSVGRAALAPSNLAQTFTMAGGLSLPWRTRFNSTLSYSRRSQNEAFIPYTSNTALTNPNLAIEPHSLNGDVRTLLANFVASTHPLRDVSVTARFRYWDFNDRTQTFTGKQIPLEVITDRSITSFADTTGVTERFPYTKNNAGLEAHWSPNRWVGVQASYGWERWNREGDVEVVKTREGTPRLAIDINPADWVSLRASVSRSIRRNDGYADSTGNDNFSGFRRFNLADRDRKAADVLAQLSPSDRWALSLSGSLGRAAYPHSPYGLQDDNSGEAGADLSYLVGKRLTVFGSYTYEVYRLSELNRYRDGSNPNNPTFAYRFGERDLMQTAGVGLTGTLVPKKLDVQARWDRSRGRTLLTDANPLAPAATSSSSVLNATATDFPEINHTWTPFQVSLRYRLNDSWSGSLGFTRDDWQSDDFRTGNLGTLVHSAITPPAISGVPLGNELLPYRASYLTFTVSFRPGVAQTLAVSPIF